MDNDININYNNNDFHIDVSPSGTEDEFNNHLLDKINTNNNNKHILSNPNTNTNKQNIKNPSSNSQTRLRVPSQKKFQISEDSDIATMNNNNNVVVVHSKTPNISDDYSIDNISGQNPHIIYSKYQQKKKSIGGASRLIDQSALSASLKYNRTNSIQKYESVIQKYVIEITDLKKQIYQLKGDNITLQEENSLLRLEKEKISKIKENEISTLNEQLLSYETQNKKLTHQNQQHVNTLDEYTPKIMQYNELNDKYKKILKENESLLTSNTSLNEVIAQLKKDSVEQTSKTELMALENQNLKQDQVFLRKTKDANETTINALRNQIQQLENDLRETRIHNQAYIDKLTDKHLSLDTNYKQKINDELNEMKAQHDKEKQQLKTHYDELTLQKTTYLQNELNDYKSKNTKNEKIIKDKDELINTLTLQYNNLNNETNKELSYLKLQLNIKTEELSTRNNLYDEQYAMLSLLKNENDALKEKVDLLRGELIKKEGDFRIEVSDHKAQIAVLKEKINVYDNIENELDNVIKDNTIAGETTNNDVTAVLPTNSKKRVNQCIALANKVKLLTIENEKLKNMNEQLHKQLTALRDENEVYKSVADKAKQPYSYLVKNLQDREIDIFNLKFENEQKEQTIRRLMKENELYEDKVVNLGNDLKRICNNREKLENLENVITSFIHNEHNGNYANTMPIPNFYENVNVNANVQQPEKDVNVDMDRVGYGTTNMSINRNMGGTTNMSINNNNINNISNGGVGTGMISVNGSNGGNNGCGNGTTVMKMPNWYMKLQANKQKY